MRFASFGWLSSVKRFDRPLYSFQSWCACGWKQRLWPTDTGRQQFLPDNVRTPQTAMMNNKTQAIKSTRLGKVLIVTSGQVMASKSFQPLFKGERTWKVWVEDRGSDGVYLLRSYGLVGKTQVLSENEVTKKDAFARTWDRAIVEAQSLWKAQRDKAYDVFDEEDKQPSKVLPMLARDFKKHGSILPDEVIFQPKLDGVRLIVGNVSDGKKEVLQSTSRSGKPLNVPHVVKAL
jgi:hypothetical protein